MPVIRKAPIVFLLLPLIGGILYGLFIGGISYGFTFSCILILFFLLVFTLQKRVGKLYSIRWLQGLLVSICCFFIGLLAVINSDISQRENFYRPSQQDELLLLRAESPAQEKECTYKFIGSIERVLKDGRWQSSCGKTLIYLPKEDALSLPVYGDLILVKPTLRPINPPRNPYEFDYRRYMQLQNIHYQTFLKAGEWEPTEVNDGYYAQGLIYEFRDYLTGIAEQHIRGREELGVFKALMLGEKEDLLPHVRDSYAGTGTMHVLAVSGLHVGILFMVFNVMFVFLTRSSYGRIGRLLLIITILWTYAFITGLSPSVMRAAAMFSLMLIGLDLKRVSNIYNAIAVSALALLLFEPQLILNVGFQLSFIAVIGIVWLQPKIYGGIEEPARKVPKYIWALISTTIAAQIATFPLGLFYFHQFPSLFLFTNLVAIPYVFVLMCAGLLFFVLNITGVSGELAILYNTALEMAIKGLNKLMFFFEGLPKASLKGVHIDLAECMIIYGLILLIASAFIYRKKLYLRYSLGLMLVFVLWHGNRLYAATATNELVIYSVSKSLVLTIKENERVQVLADSAFLANKNNIRFHVEPYLTASQAEEVRYTNLESAYCRGDNFCYSAPYGKAGNKNFLVINDQQGTEGLQNDTTFYEFIIITGSPKLSIATLKSRLNFGRIILSPNNKGYLCRDWIAECKDIGVTCVNMYDSNSLTIKL